MSALRARSWRPPAACIGPQLSPQMVECRAHAHARPQVSVHDEPDLEVEREVLRHHANEFVTAADRHLAYSDAVSGTDRGQVREIAVGAEREQVTPGWHAFGQEGPYDRCLLVIPDQRMAAQVVEGSRCAVGFEIAAMGVHPKGDLADFPGDKRCLRRPHITDGQIDIPSQEVAHLVGDYEFDGQQRVPRAQACEHGRQHFHADDLAGAEAHGASHFVRSAGRGANEGGRRSGHRLRMWLEFEGGLSWLQAVLRAREQGSAEGRLQCGDMAADRGLREFERAGGAGEASGLKGGKERPVELPAWFNGLGHAEMYSGYSRFHNLLDRQEPPACRHEIRQWRQPMSKTRTALVLGATGGVGGEVARALLCGGWRVRALHRRPHDQRNNAEANGIEWVSGDAMQRDQVIAAAEGADVIVHGVNPPGYRNWRGLALPMLESSIAAAKSSGARIVFPGTVYNFGPDAFPVLRERSPQNPTTRKGKIRVEMERRLESVSADGVRTLIVRAGDFFGPRTGNSWFAQGLIKPRRPIQSITYPGRPDAGHAWAYLPDVAEAVVQLLDREPELADFDVFHFGGHWLEPGIEMARAIQRVVGKPHPQIRRFPWALAYLASPFVTVLREMLELRYLWQQPVRLDNAKLVAFLGTEPHTPIDDAVRTTLLGLGCLHGGDAVRPTAGPKTRATAIG